MTHTCQKKSIMFVAGFLAFVMGTCVLAAYGYRKISRELRLQKLMRNNVVIEITDLNIKAPVLEGTDNGSFVDCRGTFHRYQ